MEHVSLISWGRSCPSWNPPLPNWTDLNPDLTHSKITGTNIRAHTVGVNRKRDHEKLGFTTLFKKKLQPLLENPEAFSRRCGKYQK
jgi:hypothetical protein